MKKYEVTFNDKVGVIDIESDDLTYSDINGGYGMQCNHVGGTDNYITIARECRKIIEALKVIKKVNKTKH